MDQVKSFKDLRTWQEAQDLVLLVYEVTRYFPAEEKFGLASQLRRAAVSIPSNIAEGMGRGSVKDLCRFLVIARGSVHEVISQLLTANRLGFLNEGDCTKLEKRFEGLNAGINAHMKSLSKHYK